MEIDRLLPDDVGGGAYLQGLLKLARDPEIGIHIQAAARNDEDRIQSENRSGEDDDEQDQALGWLKEVAKAGQTDIERLVLILAEAQRKPALGNSLAWFHGAGGLRKPHGILAGDLRLRRGWRYAPSNDLLAVLVQLAAARIPKDENGRECGPELIRLQDFLGFLHRRFGLLVNRPPAEFSGPEYAAAARDNLRAMLRRLRQMGIFRDLSDDFTVQRLHPPYLHDSAAKEKTNVG